MSTAATVALRIERFDGAHGFDDPAVPASLTIEQLTARAVPKLRYPSTDVSSGKPLRYSMLHDGTELARDQTVGTAIQKPRSVVHVVHVARPPASGAEAALERTCETLSAQGILAVPAILTGEPASALTLYLEKTGAGLLAMTTHGRDGVARALVGSVTEDVVRHCAVPVLIRRAEPSPIPAIA